MLIFVRTKTSTVELAEKLEARGFSSAPLNGDMAQALRERTVGRLKNGSLDILVATDVAARGLDVERISHVVNYDIPYDTEAYIHRIGRTARAGRSGEAIIFVAPREGRMLRSIEKATGKTIDAMPLPSQEDIVDRRVNQFKALISSTIESEDLEAFESIIASYQQIHGADLSEIAAALAFLVQRDRPLSPNLPKIPEQKFDEERASRQKPASRDHPSRGERKSVHDRPGPVKKPEAGMERYRIAVGRDHEVLPKHIVGAIANEAGLDSENIGYIKLYDAYSTVDLPEGMPKDIFQLLRKVRVRGQQLRIELDHGAGASAKCETGTINQAKKAKKPKKPKRVDAKKREKRTERA